MDGLYSVTLMAALASAAIGAVSSILAYRRSAALWQRVALFFVSLALLSGGVSCAVHLHVGHGPTTPEPIDIGRFLRVHPANVVVLLLTLFGFGIAMWPRLRG